MRKLRVSGDPHSNIPLSVSAFRLTGLLVLVGLLSSIFPEICFGLEAPSTKNVLLLYSFTERDAFDSVGSIESTLRSKVPWPIDFEVEFVEGQRLDDKAYERSVVENFRGAYARQNVDLVIAFAYPALDFAFRHRAELFSNAPIVFAEMSPLRLTGQKWPRVTGVTEADGGDRETVDFALRLHPDADTVAIVTNSSGFEKFWLAKLHNDLAQHPRRVAVVDLVGLPPDRLFEKVKDLPLHSIILFQEGLQAAKQPAIGPYEVVEFLGRKRPTYSIWPLVCLGHGCIGGVGWDNHEQTLIATELAKRVLSGEQPDAIPIVHSNTLRTQVDWKQLKYWHIPESALPHGSLVLYREPTLWERDRRYIIAAIVVILLQFLWIGALLWQRARKRKAEVVLLESEKRFRVMAEAAPLLIWMCDPAGKITYLNWRKAEYTGPDPKAGYGDTWKRYVHPEDLRTLLPFFAQALKTPGPFSNQYRLRRLDGEYRWQFDVVSTRVNGDGSFAGFIGSAVDITDQKVAQDALERVSGHLIEAQEKERSRIARDLHDDICQRLALLSMELEQANRNGASPSTKEHLAQIQQHCSEIAGDVQALSHRLHSSKLDYLGIAAGVRGFCKEVAKQHKVTVEFHQENVPTHLPKDVTLCLFRITQEALHNAVKYSRTTQFTVNLTTQGDEVLLEVRDHGIGFDLEEAKKNGGLGLLSMEERVHLVHGTFHLESAPGKGTRVVASVPLTEEPDVASTTPDERASRAGAA